MGRRRLKWLKEKQKRKKRDSRRWQNEKENINGLIENQES